MIEKGDESTESENGHTVGLAHRSVVTTATPGSFRSSAAKEDSSAAATAAIARTAEVSGTRAAPPMKAMSEIRSAVSLYSSPAGRPV